VRMGKLPEESSTIQKGGVVMKPLDLIVPDSVSNRFANFAVVQHESEFFTLSFFEIQKPVLLATTQEDRKKTAEDLSGVPAVCVARVVVPPSHFRKLVDAMQENLRKYEKKQGTEKK